MVLVAMLLIGLFSTGQMPGRERPPTFRFLGTYAQALEGRDHIERYELVLWAGDDGTAVGRWSRAIGPLEDFATTTITDGSYHGGTLRFSASWCDEHTTFDGALSRTTVFGMLHEVPVGQSAPVGTKLFKLTQIPEQRDMSKSAWDQETAQIVRLHGPKCL